MDGDQTSPALIEIAALTKRYGDQFPLADIAFDVRRGEVLGIIGPNGAGKTTLLRLVTKILRPDGGRIVFGGEDITALRPWEVVDRGIAGTFQNTRPFRHLPIVANVMVPLVAPRARLVAIADVVEEAARQCAAEYAVGRVFTDYRALLQSREIDAVVVCSATDTHAQIIQEAADPEVKLTVAEWMTRGYSLTSDRQLTDDELAACGIGPEMIRLSIGMEDVEDILWDIEQALDRSQREGAAALSPGEPAPVPSADSDSTAMPSSAQGGGRLPNCPAMTTCVVSCGSTDSSIPGKSQRRCICRLTTRPVPSSVAKREWPGAAAAMMKAALD